jgi:hypothetical protein
LTDQLSTNVDVEFATERRTGPSERRSTNGVIDSAGVGDLRRRRFRCGHGVRPAVVLR